MDGDTLSAGMGMGRSLSAKAEERMREREREREEEIAFSIRKFSFPDQLSGRSNIAMQSEAVKGQVVLSGF